MENALQDLTVLEALLQKHVLYATPVNTPIHMEQVHVSIYVKGGNIVHKDLPVVASAQQVELVRVMVPSRRMNVSMYLLGNFLMEKTLLTDNYVLKALTKMSQES